MRMGGFTQVADAGKGWTEVVAPDGSVIRREGARNWRNNNPGNIEYGEFARNSGAIGTDGRFAVFPTYEEGRAAKAKLLFESPNYRNKTIAGAISRYAPSFENDTNSYIGAVASSIGASPSTRVSDLSPQQRETMLSAMERVEGFKVGREKPLSGATRPAPAATGPYGVDPYAVPSDLAPYGQITAPSLDFQAPPELGGRQEPSRIASRDVSVPSPLSFAPDGPGETGRGIGKGLPDGSFGALAGILLGTAVGGPAGAVLGGELGRKMALGGFGSPAGGPLGGGLGGLAGRSTGAGFGFGAFGGPTQLGLGPNSGLASHATAEGMGLGRFLRS